jgi:transglycosylase-like protein with SLT domain
MTIYNFSQLEQLWINAGGSHGLAPLAAAIAIVESGGNPAAQNPDPRSQASGLWQLINSNWHLIPGGAANRFNPSDNAIGAVRLSGNTLSGLVSNWIDSESPGAAYAVLKQHGGQVPSGSLPPESSASTGGSGSSGTSAAAQQATLTSWTSIGSDIIDPFQAIAKSLGTIITKPWDIATSVTRLATDFNSLVGIFNTFLKDVEWLFVPSNWIRIFAFIFGIGALIPGVWALLRVGSGQQGDITMALGILLITVAGVLLFVAFHNLPTTVTDLRGLLNYVSEGIQQGAAPDTTAPGFGPASAQAAAGG